MGILCCKMCNCGQANREVEISTIADPNWEVTKITDFPEIEMTDVEKMWLDLIERGASKQGEPPMLHRKETSPFGKPPTKGITIFVGGPKRYRPPPVKSTMVYIE